MSLNEEQIQLIIRYEPKLLVPTTRMAAVMVMLLTGTQNNMNIVITKRSANLPTYPGHFSLPGGMQDPGDFDLYKTAIREVKEELNITPNQYQRIGQLNDFVDRYGDLVRPFVTIMDEHFFRETYQISESEITQVYFLPIRHLIHFYDEPSLHALTQNKPSYAYKDGNVFIWGLTARILMHFKQIITTKADNKETR